MKLALLLFTAVAAFAGVFYVLARSAPSPSSTLPFWVAATVSAAVLSGGLYIGLRRYKPRPLLAVATVLFSFALVAASNVLAAVFVACSLGDCI